MKIKFVGDIHGNWHSLPLVDIEDPCIQLGDFNLFGYDIWFHKYGEHIPYEFKNKTLFLDGNHDNFVALHKMLDSTQIQEVDKNVYYIPRGYISGKVLFIGGADSPPFDRIHRTAGRDWFPEETLSQRQFRKIMEIEQEIEVIVSHDAPDFVVRKLLKEVLGNFTDYQLPMPKALTSIFDKFKPKLWAFGHYHASWQKKIQGCQFRCVNINEVVEIDVPVGDDLFEGKENDGQEV